MAKTNKAKYTCLCCGNDYVETNFYKSYSRLFSKIGKIPYCEQCVEKFYQQYYEEYVNEGCLTPEKNAIKRVCMTFDIYYTDDVFNSAVNKIRESNINISPMGQYMKTMQLSQYKDKSYDNTVLNEMKNEFVASVSNDASINMEVDQKTIDFFGSGFTKEDYKFLQREYDDWTARHECNTKAQEEVFKRICFKQLEILKATRKNEDTKNLDATFQNLLDTAKLQPKQNSGDATAENQTLGTLIDKWENERPLPEIDEELRDVDKIGLYIDTFFKGHTCKMLGEKNAYSNLYSSMMKQFTVDKPEYESDEDYDSEVVFDKLIGAALEDCG